MYSTYARFSSPRKACLIASLALSQSIRSKAAQISVEYKLKPCVPERVEIPNAAEKILSDHAIFRRISRNSTVVGNEERFDPMAIFTSRIPSVSLPRPEGDFYIQYLFLNSFVVNLSAKGSELTLSTSFHSPEVWKSEIVQARLKEHFFDGLQKMGACLNFESPALLKVHKASFQSAAAEAEFRVQFIKVAKIFAQSRPAIFALSEIEEDARSIILPMLRHPWDDAYTRALVDFVDAFVELQNQGPTDIQKLEDLQKFGIDPAIFSPPHAPHLGHGLSCQEPMT